MNSRTVPEDAAPAATGNLFVVAAPSGGGKTSLVNALLEREPGIRLSVSYTTRPPRPGEIDGVHYRFVDEPGFLARKDAGEFLEHAHVHGNWYATSGTWLASEVAAGPRRAARDRLAGGAAGPARCCRRRSASSSCRRRSRR